MSEEINCPFCGNLIEVNAIKCPNCNALFKEPELPNIKFKELGTHQIPGHQAAAEQGGKEEKEGETFPALYAFIG